MKTREVSDGCFAFGAKYDDGVVILAHPAWHRPVSIDLAFGDDRTGHPDGFVSFSLAADRARALHEALGLALAHLDAPKPAASEVAQESGS